MRISLYPIISILVLKLLHVIAFSNPEYRLDEIWRLHKSIHGNPTQVLRFMVDVNAPLYSILAQEWMDWVGHSEIAVRHLSSLLAALTLSFLYRMMVDLYGKRVSKWALIIFLSFPQVFYYTYDASSYVIYLLSTVMSTFFFLRWLSTGKGFYTFNYVGTGIIGIYSHYFFAFTILSHAFLIIFFIKWNTRFLLKGLILFVSIGVAFVGGWGLPFINQIFVVGNLTHAYTTQFTLSSALEALDKLAISLPIMILIFVIFASSTSHHLRDKRLEKLVRFGHDGLVIFFASTTLLFLLFLFWLNSYHLTLFTDRNLSFIYLPLTVICVAGLRQLSGPYKFAFAFVLSLNVLPYIVERTGVAMEPGVRNGSRAVSNYIAEEQVSNRVFVFEQGQTTYHFTPLFYYITERLPGSQPHVALINPDPRWRVPIPELPELIITNFETASRNQLQAHISNASQIWHIILSTSPLQNRIFDLYGTHDFGYVEQVSIKDMLVREYRRLPEPSSDIYIFDTSIEMLGWQINQIDVEPCQLLELVSSWHLSRETTPHTFSMNLTLIGEEGQPIAGTNSGISAIPTHTWHPNQAYIDVREVTVPCEIKPGSYPLGFTVISSEDYNDLAGVTNSQEQSLENFVYLTNIQVNTN